MPCPKSRESITFTPGLSAIKPNVLIFLVSVLVMGEIKLISTLRFITCR